MECLQLSSCRGFSRVDQPLHRESGEGSPQGHGKTHNLEHQQSSVEDFEGSPGSRKLKVQDGRVKSVLMA